jgi:hypothetical protein
MGRAPNRTFAGVKEASDAWMTGPNAATAALRTPSPMADASFRFRREPSQEESSFSEEKEAKRLYPLDVDGPRLARAKSEKFFGSFFQKRTCFIFVGVEGRTGLLRFARNDGEGCYTNPPKD